MLVIIPEKHRDLFNKIIVGFGAILESNYLLSLPNGDKVYSTYVNETDIAFEAHKIDRGSRYIISPVGDCYLASALEIYNEVKSEYDRESTEHESVAEIGLERICS